MPKKLDWELMSEKAINAIKTGDFSVKSMDLTSGEFQKLKKEMKKENYQRSIFFYLLRKIYEYYVEKINNKIAGIRKYAPEKYEEAIREELELLKKQPEIMWCLRLEILNKQIRGEKASELFQNL